MFNLRELVTIEVDAFKTVSADLPKSEVVIQSATAALSAFEVLKRRFDFVAEGRSSFTNAFQSFEADGGDLEEVMRFVWYVKAL